MLNSNEEIVGVIASKAADGCLAISVSQIHKFLDDAEIAYEDRQKYGKHLVNFKIKSDKDKFFEIVKANPNIKNYKDYVGNDMIRKRITMIKIEKEIDGEMKIVKYKVSHPEANLLIEQINRGIGEFRVRNLIFLRKNKSNLR